MDKFQELRGAVLLPPTTVVQVVHGRLITGVAFFTEGLIDWEVATGLPDLYEYHSWDKGKLHRLRIPYGFGAGSLLEVREANKGCTPHPKELVLGVFNIQQAAEELCAWADRGGTEGNRITDLQDGQVVVALPELFVGNIHLMRYGWEERLPFLQVLAVENVPLYIPIPPSEDRHLATEDWGKVGDLIERWNGIHLPAYIKNRLLYQPDDPYGNGPCVLVCHLGRCPH